MLYRIDNYRKGLMICLKNHRTDLFDEYQELFRQSWNIEDHESAIARLDALLNSGSRNDAGYMEEAQEIFEEMKKVTGRSPKAETFIQSVKMMRVGKGANPFILEQEVLGCRTIAAWDFIRGANLAQTCYFLGYIDEATAWHYLEQFCQLLKQSFHSC